MRDRLLRRESKNRDSHPGRRRAVDPPGGAPGRGGRSPAKSALPGLRWPGSTLSGTGASASGRWPTGGAGSEGAAVLRSELPERFPRSRQAGALVKERTGRGRPGIGGRGICLQSSDNLRPILGLQSQWRSGYFTIRVRAFGVDPTISDNRSPIVPQSFPNLCPMISAKWHLFCNATQYI